MHLFLYVIKDYFRYVLVTLTLIVSLFTLFDFIHKSTSFFSKYDPSWALVAQSYLYQTPFQLFQALPITALISGVIVMVLMSRSGEVTAMRAAGMSPRQIMLPLAIGGLLLSVVSLLLGEVVTPRAARKMRYIKEVLIRGEQAQELNRESHWIRVGDTTFNFAEFSPQSRVFKDVHLIRLGETFQAVEHIHARSARPLDANNTWELSDVRIISMGASQGVKNFASQSTMLLTLQIDSSQLIVERRTPFEMSLGELSTAIRSGISSGVDVLDYQISWHLKLAFHFAALLLSLLALPFGYRAERTAEKLKSLAKVFAIGIVYWILLSAGKVFAAVGSIPPVLGGWLANIWILVVITWQFYRNQVRI